MSFHHSYVILSFLFQSIIPMSFHHLNVIPIIRMSFCHYIVIPMSFHHSYVIPSFLCHSIIPMSFHHSYVIPCHSYVIPFHSMSFRHHSSRPLWPCHKVWRKVVHPKVRLGKVTGMMLGWLFPSFDGHSKSEWPLNVEMMLEWQGWKLCHPGIFPQEWPRNDPFSSFQHHSVIRGWGWMRWSRPLSI